MRAVILSIGSELLRGDIVDTNAPFLARELSRLGFEPARLEAVGDDMDALTGAFREALSLAQITIGTGGLGPTEDDLTREAIAAVLGEETSIDETAATAIDTYFRGTGRHMPASNRKQAMTIPSAEVLPNPNGTAPGWLVRQGDRIVVAMPGPPQEMKAMWRDAVRPRLERLLPGKPAMRSVMTFGLGESAVEEKIAEVIHWRPDVTVATYAKSNGIQVHVTARAGTEDEAELLASEAQQRLHEALGETIFGSGDESLSEVVGRILLSTGRTLAAMESATGGLLSDTITAVPGSSQYFLGGIVAYSREAKVRFGVDGDTMDRHGLISPETAGSMAEAACRGLGSDVGMAVSGVAGTEPVEGKAPGTAYIAVASDGHTEVREIRRPARRDVAKRFFAQCALDLLRRQLMKRNGE